MFEGIKKALGADGEEPEYIEIDLGREIKRSKVMVRPFVLKSFEDINAILNSLREGYTIAVIDIKQLRAKDVIETLNEKEKKIVNYLLEHENKGVQSSIRHETGIPRTSLARCLKSLQIKKIIEVEKFGKAIKIKLTDWFLEKE